MAGNRYRKSRLIFPLLATAFSLSLHGTAASAASTETGDSRAENLTALELELVDAGDEGTPLRIDADSGGRAVIWAPYRTLEPQVGQLRIVEAQGQVTLDGSTEAGAINGQLAATLPGEARRSRRPLEERAVDVAITGQVRQGVVSGRWTIGERSGPLHGFARTVSTDDNAWTNGVVTLDRAYPFPGREGQFGYGEVQARLGAAFTLERGRVTEGRTGPNRARASWFPGQSFRPMSWVLPNGQPVVIVVAGYPHGENSVAGAVDDGTLSLRLIASVDHQPEPVVWDVTMKRAGTLWYGVWRWTAAKGQTQRQGVAAGRLTTGARALASRPEGESPRARLLRHALALAEHPGNVLFCDDLLSHAAGGTGNKQYDNPPNNVGAAILTGLLLDRLSDDPMVRAEGRAMARRAAYWWNLSRIGPLRIGEYYKGMFYTTAWAGFGLAALAEADPTGPWVQWSAELAQSLTRAQLPSGAWTWVDENTGKKGKSNDRHDSSKDDRQLNCVDLLLALSQLNDAVARAERVESPAGQDKAADEADAVTPADAERRAAEFLAKALDDPPAWFFQGRRPDTYPEPLGTLCYLQWLVEQPQPSSKEIAKVRAIIDSRFIIEESGLVRGYQPRWGSGDGPGADLSASARYAHVLALLGARGDQEAGERAFRLTKAILDAASPQSGLIDHRGRPLPKAPAELGPIDIHAYLCLKAAIGWELLDAIEANEALRTRLDRRSQAIHFPALPNIPADSAPLDVKVKADSGLPVTLHVLEGPARVDGHRIVIEQGSGVVRIEARQVGDARYFAAQPVVRTFAVGDAYPKPAGDARAHAIAADAVRVTWRDNADDEVGYRIEMRPAPHDDAKPAPFRTVVTLPADRTRHDLTQLPVGATIDVRIVAFNRAIDAPPSETVRVAAHPNVFRVAMEIEDGDVGDDWQRREDDAASGGACLVAMVSHRQAGPGEGDEAAIVSLPFEAPEPGQYRVHYRSWGNSGGNDSQFLRVADQPWQVIGTGNTGSFRWATAAIELPRPGAYTLQFGCREASGMIDAVVITNGPGGPGDGGVR